MKYIIYIMSKKEEKTVLFLNSVARAQGAECLRQLADKPVRGVSLGRRPPQRPPSHPGSHAVFPPLYTQLKIL